MRTKWGQNFLANPSTAGKIVAALGAGPGDQVLEIGPGRGALTSHLMGRAGRLAAVELDAELAARLRQNFPGLEVHVADFLRWPLPEGQWLVIGNLPYSAGGAILRKILDWPGWTRGVFMLQKEVALRVCAGAGGRDYGILSLAVAAKARPQRLFDVAPGAFRPAPKVTSTVVRLERLLSPLVQDEERFFRVVKAAFGQRRKTVVNSLMGGMGLDRETVERAIGQAGLDPALRPERLTLENYCRLAAELP